MADILEIRMQRGMLECSICGYDTEHRWGVPTYNGDIVSNNFPDEMLAREGGSMPVCEECFDRHARGELDTLDRFYVLDGPLGVALVDGGGI